MSAWGTTGTVQAWANQVEEEEEAGNALGPADRPKPQVPQGPALGADTGAFPSLGEAAKQPRKKKGKAISLAEFQSGPPAPRQGTYQAPSSRAPPAEVKERLPTGPRERSADDDGRGGRSFGGGGFRGELQHPTSMWQTLTHLCVVLRRSAPANVQVAATLMMRTVLRGKTRAPLGQT